MRLLVVVGFRKLDTLLTSMPRTNHSTGSSENLTLTAVAVVVENDEVSGLGGGRANETDDNFTQVQKHQKTVKGLKICKGPTFGTIYLLKLRS